MLIGHNNIQVQYISGGRIWKHQFHHKITGEVGGLDLQE